MARGRSRDERKERQWRRWIRGQRASGMSVRAYCAMHGLAVPRFYAWRRELERREPAAFVPVRVIATEHCDNHDASDDDTQHGDERPRHGDGVDRAAGTLEVVLAGGRTVRVTTGFDAATLRQLLAVLEGKPC